MVTRLKPSLYNLLPFEPLTIYPKGPTVKVYGIRAIVVEKLQALSDRARHELRDCTATQMRLPSYDPVAASMIFCSVA